jgi:hypothetical protein
MVLAGAWAGALSHKYGYFTTGSTGPFNVAFNGPNWVAPMHTGRILPVPTPSGTSGWDDATVTDYTRWNPLGTSADRKVFEKNRTRNEADIIKILLKFTWMLWPIVLVGVRAAGSSLDPSPRRPGAILVAMLLLYPLGYYLLHVYERFLSLLCIGLLVLGVYAACRITWPLWWWIRVPLRLIIVSLVAYSFLSNSEWNSKADPVHMALGRWSIAKRWGREDFHREHAALLVDVIPPRASFVSSGNWSESLYLALHLNLRYYGDAPTARLADVRSHGIEYCWVWRDGRRPEFLKNAPEISAGKVPGLQIYDVRAKPATAPATTHSSYLAPRTILADAAELLPTALRGPLDTD